MLGRINKKWLYLSYFGVKEEQPISTQKRIILTNQVAMVAFTALFILNTYYLIVYEATIVTLLSFISIFSIPSILLANKRGKFYSTSFSLSVVTPILTLIFTSLSLQNYTERDVTHYFFGRVLLMSELCIPLILIDIRRKVLLMIAILVNLTCIALYDPVHQLFGSGIFQGTKVSFESYYSINFLIIIPISLLLFGFYFLLKLNQKYENRIYHMLEEMTEKNTILQQQKEEIITQNEALQHSQEEIMVQNEALQQSKEEIMVQNEEILLAKDEISKQKKDIIDSINYASKIQNAVLPSHEIFNELLPDHFVIFKPRDIVSGDFYWIKQIKNFIIVAVADCTGHGVPGAFMSMLGISFLNEIVSRASIDSTGLIIENLRKKIKHTLKQYDPNLNQKDGMDMILFSIDMESLEMQYSGAYNSLYILRESGEPLGLFTNNKILTLQNESISLIELKADRQPVGVHLMEREFTTISFQLKKNDVLYAGSDGFIDQIGGHRRMKFMSKNYKRLLLEIFTKPLSEQKEILENTLDRWRNGFDQLDDVLILGVKV
jgi:serine phosphatase RsbU (regulator of sigma subunit)